MSNKKPKMKPVAPLNIAFLVLFVLVGVGLLVTEQFIMAALIFVGVAYLVWAIWRARKKKFNQKDTSRVDALEYADERDAEIGQRSIANMGSVGVILVTAATFSNVIFEWAPPITTSVLALILLAMCLVWTVSTRYYARRL